MLLLLNWVVTNAKNFGQFRKLYVAVWNILCELYQDRGTGGQKNGNWINEKNHIERVVQENEKKGDSRTRFLKNAEKTELLI